MHEGLERQGISPNQVQLMQADLLGISDTAYRSFCDTILEEIRQQVRQGAVHPKVIEQLFLACMQDAFQTRKPTDLLQAGVISDYVICCGVHSQLLNMFPQMAGILRRYIPFALDAIYAAVRGMNGTLARELNSQLLSVATAGTILGLETERVGIAGGIEGAAQALQDIQERNMNTAFETELLWPFDRSQGKVYQISVKLIPALRMQ